jgi:hypothetical protein
LGYSGCPAPFGKIFRFPRRANQKYDSPRPASIRGAYASSRTLGAGCGGRDGVARRAALARTAKSCGPDAPTLASSLRGGNSRKRRWQESPVAGEITKETVKTIARGMPGDPGVTVVTMLVCFLILHTRLRAHRAPGIPCALLFSKGGYATTRALFARREGGGVDIARRNKRIPSW